MVIRDIPDVMSGVVLTGHGGPEKLEYRTDLPVPSPAAGEVLIRVMAAGVNNTDINTRVGWYSKSQQEEDDASWTGDAIQFPRVQGIDVYGEIVAVGTGVDTERIGQMVLVEPCLLEAGGQPLDPPWFLGSECDGGFAEYVAVASRHAYTTRSSMRSVELASFPCSYSTAENMLTRADVREGERVLVTGASGGVGSAAIQLAKARGAQVIAVTQEAKAQVLRNVGADEIVLRGASYVEQLGENSVDVVLDLVAGSQWAELLDVLKWGGRYAVAGAIGGPMVELDVRTLYLKDLSLLGCTVLESGVFANLVSHIENERIRPLIAGTYQLEDIHAAQAAFEQKRHVGKIVLTLADDAYVPNR